jgi:hypothetical protein
LPKLGLGSLPCLGRGAQLAPRPFLLLLENETERYGKPRCEPDGEEV